MTRTCIAPNCEKPSHAKNLCSAHYSYAIRSHEIAPSWIHVSKRKTAKNLPKNISKTREYITWRDMLRRCYDPDNVSYKYYGGAGVRVCDRWRESFMNFYNDMGKKPEGYTIDRIDGYGDYEPGNVRWATWSQQARNKNSKYKRLALFRDEYDNEGDFSQTLEII